MPIEINKDLTNRDLLVILATSFNNQERHLSSMDNHLLQLNGVVGTNALNIAINSERITELRGKASFLNISRNKLISVIGGGIAIIGGLLLGIYQIIEYALTHS